MQTDGEHTLQSRFVSRLLEILLISFAPAGVAISSTLSPYQIYPVPVWPNGWPDVVTVGDFNGDGRDDVVLGTTIVDNSENPATDFHLFVFLQLADGSLAPPYSVAYSSFNEEGNYSIGLRKRTGITSVDLNKDGIDDVVIGRRTGVTVFMGSRTARLVAKRVECTTGACMADQITSMDVDRDGNADVLAHNETDANLKFGITIYYGDGTGQFPRQRFLPTMSDGGVELKIGDLNNDGLPDIAMSWLQGLTSGVEIFLHNGIDWFRPGIYTVRPSDMINAGALAVGDFNGDRRDDYALGGSTYSFDGKGLFLYPQAASETMRPPMLLPAAIEPDSANVPDTALTADLSRDGRDDLVVLRSGGLIGYLQSSSSGLTAEHLYPGPYATWSSSQGLATGDINHDGCADVVTANYNYGLVVWRGLGCLQTVPAPSRIKAADVNANGNSDVLWRDLRTGANALWYSGSYNDRRLVTGVSDIDYAIVGIGDFDGDRTADVLWRNRVTGANAIWRTAYPTPTPLRGVTDPAWKVAGVGDFDGDHRSDIYWRNDVTGANVIWRAANSAWQTKLPTVSDTGWRVVGVSDFDADGKSDVLWHQGGTGGNLIWRSGLAATQQAVTNAPSIFWRVAGVGDFNGDGRGDILWRDLTSGANQIWLSANSGTQQSIASVSDQAWQVAAIGDYNGDGKDDVFWRNAKTGANSIWRSGNAAAQTVVQAVNTDWIVAPAIQN